MLDTTNAISNTVSKAATTDPIAGETEAFRHDVLSGLSRPHKTLPCRWLYDEVGSALFEDITRLDEYYPTRVETGILQRRAQDLAQFAGDHAVVLEFGAGAGIKTEILIDALATPRLYVPIDIAGAVLDQTVARFRDRFPRLETRAVVADFTAPLALPAWVPPGHRVGFFPGSTIGNLEAHEAALFLRRLRRHVGVEGRAIIGVDLAKDVDMLLEAYDDAAGVTAAFNLNLLARVNRELDGDFVLDQFAHSARWNDEESAVEMHLVSLVSQVVTVAGHRFHFDPDETIHTESSRKYRVRDFATLAHRSGWRADRLWTDELGLFAVFGLS